jgi:hypothetical protein
VPGGIWKRPVFDFPYVQSPQAVFRPVNFYGTNGLGQLLPQSATGWLVLAGLIAGAAYFAYKRGRKTGAREGHTRGRQMAELKAARMGPGWYVLLYNYPEGHIDRRLKSYRGRFNTKAEAEEVAAEERDTWYTKVQRRSDAPW